LGIADVSVARSTSAGARVTSVVVWPMPSIWARLMSSAALPDVSGGSADAERERATAAGAEAKVRGREAEARDDKPEGVSEEECVARIRRASSKSAGGGGALRR